MQKHRKRRCDPSGLNDLSPETMKWPGRSLRICRICLPRRWISRCLSKLAPSWPCSKHEQLSLILWMVGFHSVVWSIRGQVYRSIQVLSSLDGKEDRSCCACGTQRQPIFHWIKRSAKVSFDMLGVLEFSDFLKGLRVLAVGFGSHSERGRQKNCSNPLVDQEPVIVEVQQIQGYRALTGWWLTYPSKKYESQLGWLISQYMEQIKLFQTSNQYRYHVASIDIL